MHTRKLLFMTVVIFMLIGFTVIIPTNSQTNSDLTALVDGNTEFAFDLYHELANGNDDNLIFSPYSISIAMAMLYAGANGETATQIADVMHYDLPPERLHPAFGVLNAILQPPESENPTPTPTPNYMIGVPANEIVLRIANGLWGQQGFPIEQSYVDTLSQNYGNELQTVDFGQSAEAREIIRQWIDDMTNGRITDMPPEGSITPATVLALVNAIYFRGDWTYPFPQRDTYDGTFYLNDDSEISVPLMVNYGFLDCGSGDGFSAIRLAYGDRRPAGMLIIMPDEDRFGEIEEQFYTMFFEEILAGLSRTNMVTFTMPKFDFTSDINLNDILSNMGMRSVFDTGADFSGISSQPVSVGYIGHSATISVDEEGTEASGVTSVVMPLSGFLVDCEREIIADRPFIFTIYDNQTRTILFMGRVMNPAE